MHEMHKIFGSRLVRTILIHNSGSEIIAIRSAVIINHRISHIHAQLINNKMEINWNAELVKASFAYTCIMVPQQYDPRSIMNDPFY